MIKKSLLPLVLLLVLPLSGCAGLFTKDPGQTVRTIQIPIPVPIVITPPEKPVMPFQQANVEDDIYAKFQKALAEIELRKGYETKLEATISPFSPENSKATFEKLYQNLGLTIPPSP
jgi:hypothetical protein